MEEREQRRLSWLNSAVWMVSGGAIAAALLIGHSTLQLGDRLFESIGARLNPPQPQPTVDVRSLIVQQIRQSSELTTASFTMQAVVPAQQDATVSGFVFGTTKLLYIAHGEVKAGVDLARLDPAQIQLRATEADNGSVNGVRIQLPIAQVLDQKIDVNRSQVYDYNRGFLGLGPDTGPALQSLAQQTALLTITTAACEAGILERASDRAKLVVTQLLQAAGHQNVVVEPQAVTVAQCLAQVRQLDAARSPVAPPEAAPQAAP